MAKLNLNKEDIKLLNDTIHYWEAEGFVDTETAKKLNSTYELKKFEWKNVAENSFTIALICGIIALVSFILNNKIMVWMEKLYDTPDIIIGFVSGILAFVFFYAGYKKKRKYPERVFSNEAIIFFGILFTASCIVYLAKSFDNGKGHFSPLFLLVTIIYALLAIRIKSNLIWTSAIVSLGLWFGTESGYQTGWRPYFLGMNYPLRFVFFGSFLILFSFLIPKNQKIHLFKNPTYMLGLFCFFMSLWLVSIFGNFGSFKDWSVAAQITLLPWAIISILVSLGFIIYGWKWKDSFAREFGIVFMLINLYSRYFEYVWGIIDKSIFFLILALSFWLIGRKAEKIWNLEIFRK